MPGKRALFDHVEKMVELDNGLRLQLAIGPFGDLACQVCRLEELAPPQAGKVWTTVGNFSCDSLTDAQLVLDTLSREVANILGQHIAARKQVVAAVTEAASAL